MVRPVDMQDNYSKAPLAGRQQHIQQISPEIAQRQAAQQQAQQHLLDQSRPRPAERRDEVELHLDERRAPEQRRRKRRRHPARENSALPDQGPEGTSHIDLTA
ncbi:MAG: hypothetical protein HYW07_22920 [Candidatus Latescibacteria bacterium]|nr:hypothetical protein [Candidatus Latescibacterota bacterium]